MMSYIYIYIYHIIGSQLLQRVAAYDGFEGEYYYYYYY